MNKEWHARTACSPTSLMYIYRYRERNGVKKKGFGNVQSPEYRIKMNTGSERTYQPFSWHFVSVYICYEGARPTPDVSHCSFNSVFCLSRNTCYAYFQNKKIGYM